MHIDYGRTSSPYAFAVFQILALLISILASPTFVHAQTCEVGWLSMDHLAGGAVQVKALHELPDGDVLVGGVFENAGGVSARNIARYQPDTNTWTALANGVYGTVWDIDVLPNGDVIVARGNSAAGLLQFSQETAQWTLFDTHIVFSDFYAIKVLPDGDVIAGGVGVVARYSALTNTWIRLGSISGEVYALAVLPNGELVAGGEFSPNSVVRYVPESNSWSPLGTGIPSSCHALFVLPNGDLIAGGDFCSPPMNCIARYSQATSSWTPLGTGMSNRVRSIGMLPNGELLAGGYFFSTGGNRRTTLNYIAKYSEDTNTWSGLESGLNDFVFTVTVLRHGDLLVGGRFTTANGNISNALARYTFGQTSCLADFNCSHSLSVDDIFDFLSVWFNLDPVADVNDDNGVSVQDIFDFLDAWFGGCN